MGPTELLDIVRNNPPIHRFRDKDEEHISIMCNDHESKRIVTHEMFNKAKDHTTNT